MSVLIGLVTFLIVVSSVAATVCDRCVHPSNVSVFLDDRKAFPHGACRYGTPGKNFTVPNFADAKLSIYKDGVGCGGCFQVRCRDRNVCTGNGTIITLTGAFNNNKNTAFKLNKKAYDEMFEKGSTHTGTRYTDVEYKRVPCDYGKNTNMNIWVEKQSNRQKNYLAIKLLYQEGQTNILAAEVVNKTKSVKMSRNGAVWGAWGVPTGALRFQFKVTSGSIDKMVTTKHELPADWKTERAYDSGFQFTEIAQETNCTHCDNTKWK